jgi:hypothetical protein
MSQPTIKLDARILDMKEDEDSKSNHIQFYIKQFL